MAGHNKWSKIKHRKKVVDKRRSKAWTMCSRAIITAAKFGGPDPEFNAALRTALDEAKYHNVPKDNIERAIKKGAGGGEADNYEAVRYEGYGPGGVAIVIESLTNNRTRTAADLRLILSKFSGNLGTTGCVSFMFETKGRLQVLGSATDEERLFEVAASAGADDITFDSESEPAVFTVMTSLAAYVAVKAAIEHAKFGINEAGIEQVPSSQSTVFGETARQVVDLIDALEDNDDVKRVFTNADIPDDVIAALE